MSLEPLSIAFCNTRRFDAGGPVDLLEPSPASWLREVGLPTAAVDLRPLREAVFELLHARIEDRRPSARAVNAAAAAAPRALRLRGRSAQLVSPGASPAQVAQAAFATSAIELVADPQVRLGACAAPGCVLVFAGGSPRRSWCSDACGNRARQARFTARHRR